jgi:hypothetical protein
MLQSDKQDGEGRSDIEILLDDGFAHDLCDVDDEGWKKQGMAAGQEEKNDKRSDWKMSEWGKHYGKRDYLGDGWRMRSVRLMKERREEKRRRDGWSRDDFIVDVFA